MGKSVLVPILKDQLAKATTIQAKLDIAKQLLDLQGDVHRSIYDQVEESLSSSITMGGVFQSMIDKVFELEGDWSDNTSDPGGATMYGISSVHNPKYANKIKSKTLTKAEAQMIYRDNYWTPIYKVDSLPLPIAWIIFDARIHGSLESIKDIQTWISKNINPSISIDGIYGKQTWENLPKSKRMLADLVSYLIERTGLSARAAAVRTMAAQKKLGLPVEDYTNGFTKRLSERYSFATDLQYS